MDVLKKLKKDAKGRQKRGDTVVSAPKFEPAGKYFVSNNWKNLLEQKPTVAPKAAAKKAAVLESGKAPDIVAMDCEMVGVGPSGTQSALARVSIVDGNGNVLLDRFVRPKEKVTDPRTHVTGITIDMLGGKGVLEEDTARKQAADLMEGKIVVGHALNNDFEVLHLSHPHAMIRDTALYKPLRPSFRANKTPSLKLLSSHWLHEEIHGGQHNSVEDARMALRLYRSQSRVWEKQLRGAMRPKTAFAEAPAEGGGASDDDEGEVVDRSQGASAKAISEKVVTPDGPVPTANLGKKRRKVAARAAAAAADAASASSPQAKKRKKKPTS